MTRITRRYMFAASHRLHSDRLSEQENARLFDKCNNPYGHGHNYFLEVTVAGEPDERTGVLVPPAVLDDYLRRRVLSRLDQRYLNEDVAEFSVFIPTTENIGRQIGRWLEESWEEVSGWRQQAGAGRGAGSGQADAQPAGAISSRSGGAAPAGPSASILRLAHLRLEETASNSFEMEFHES